MDETRLREQQAQEAARAQRREFEEQERQEQVKKGKRMVVIIVAIHMTMMVISAIADSTFVVQLIVQSVISVALVIGVNWARYLHAISSGFSVISIVIMMRQYAGLLTTLGVVISLGELGFRLAVCIMLFTNKNIAAFFAERKRELGPT